MNDENTLTRLRAARPVLPDDEADPRSPANAAIIDAILAAPVADAPLAPIRRRSGRRRLPALVAAAAVIGGLAAGFVAVSPFGPSEPSAASVVRRAVAASEEALDHGQASLTVETEGLEDTYDYRFAGDDVEVEMVLGTELDEPVSGARRVVGGEMYWHVGADPSAAWFHMTGGEPSRSSWTGDPRSLLAGLETDAGLEIVGDETVDGVELTHLRATTPGDVDVSRLGLGEATVQADTLTGLDVWVDGDDVVRRVDLAGTQTIDGEISTDGAAPEAQDTQGTTASVRFHHIGVPNEIEAPTNARAVTTDQLANPPAPGG
jgi:hypothetical protein